MKRNSLLLVLICIWLISGCRPLATPEPSVPSLTATLQAAKPTPLAMTATFTPIPTAIATPAVTATPDIAATVIAIKEPRMYSSHLSPDGKWRAEVVIYDCVAVGGVDENAYEQLKLIQVDNGVKKIADTQLQYCGGLGAFGLAGLFWSPNSRYFYYTNAREGVPDGCGYWERPIIRLDVSNLKSEYLGGGPRSPDGTRLATWQGQELVIWDINEGEIARISAMAVAAETGPIAWSPDSQALVYVQFASYCPLSGKSYVVRLDLPVFKQTLLLESETPTFGNAAWDVPYELTLFDENGRQWRYNFTTQELRQVP